MGVSAVYLYMFLGSLCDIVLFFLASMYFFSGCRHVFLDQFRFLGNCPTTPPLSHHFVLSEKKVLTLA